MKFIVYFGLETNGKMVVEADDETKAKDEMYRRISKWLKSADSKKLGLFKGEAGISMFTHISCAKVRPLSIVDDKGDKMKKTDLMKAFEKWYLKYDKEINGGGENKIVWAKNERYGIYPRLVWSEKEMSNTLFNEWKAFKAGYEFGKKVVIK